MESKYEPLSTHEKAYLFFPIRTIISIQKRNKRLSKERRDLDSSFSVTLNMTSMKERS